MARRETFQEGWERKQADPGWLLGQAERELACAESVERSWGQGQGAGHRDRARELLERAERCLGKDG